MDPFEADLAEPETRVGSAADAGHPRYRPRAPAHCKATDGLAATVSRRQAGRRDQSPVARRGRCGVNAAYGDTRMRGDPVICTSRRTVGQWREDPIGQVPRVVSRIGDRLFPAQRPRLAAAVGELRHDLAGQRPPRPRSGWPYGAAPLLSPSRNLSRSAGTPPWPRHEPAANGAGLCGSRLRES